MIPMFEPLTPAIGVVRNTKLSNPNLNRVSEADATIHNWYRFVLSFPPHLVRDYLADRFATRGGLTRGQTILDPFCGTGTTIVEARRLGYEAVGIEAHPMAHFASRVKANWIGNPGEIERLAALTAGTAERTRAATRKPRTLDAEQKKLLLKDCICEGPLNKVLILNATIEKVFPPDLIDYARLALAKVAVSTASNLHFGPEVGVRGCKLDADVFGAWQLQMKIIAGDLRMVQMQAGPFVDAMVYRADARAMNGILPPRSVNAVFTSPPYPNEKDYTRTTRLESVILGFLTDKKSLRAIKQPLMRSNTRNIYKGDEDHLYAERFTDVGKLAAEIERKRIEAGADSGFERLYHRVTTLYFGGMARHFDELRTALAPGASLGYVVGDQASFFRVHIPTAEILAKIARHYGYEHVETEVFRTRIATATKKQMEEHVLWLRWPG